MLASSKPTVRQVETKAEKVYILTFCCLGYKLLIMNKIWHCVYQKHM